MFLPSGPIQSLQREPEPEVHKEWSANFRFLPFQMQKFFLDFRRIMHRQCKILKSTLVGVLDGRFALNDLRASREMPRFPWNLWLLFRPQKRTWAKRCKARSKLSKSDFFFAKQVAPNAQVRACEARALWGGDELAFSQAASNFVEIWAPLIIVQSQSPTETYCQNSVSYLPRLSSLCCSVLLAPSWGQLPPSRCA